MNENISEEVKQKLYKIIAKIIYNEIKNNQLSQQRDERN